MPSLIILAIALPILFVFHVIFILRNRGYELRRIDHKNLTKHTGA